MHSGEAAPISSQGKTTLITLVLCVYGAANIILFFVKATVGAPALDWSHDMGEGNWMLSPHAPWDLKPELPLHHLLLAMLVLFFFFKCTSFYLWLVGIAGS